jgi:hypothetical protein
MPNGSEHGDRMSMIRRRHEHGVDLVVHRIEHFAEVGEAPRLRKLFKAPRRTPLIHIAQRHDVLARHVAQDGDGNASVADLVHVDAARNIVYDGRTKARTPITLVGVCDSIIVLTDDAVLVAARAESQKIKDLVRKLAADPRWAELV